MSTAVTQYAERGMHLAFAGHYREANNLLAHALKGEPMSAHLLCMMANVQSKLHNYAFAFEYFRRAEESNPKLPEIFLGRALMHLEIERLGMARADIEKADALLQGDFRVHLLKAQYQLQMGQVEKARAEANLALELQPRSESCLLMMAQIQERRGRWEDAVDLYEKVIREVDPLSRAAIQSRDRLIGRHISAA